MKASEVPSIGLQKVVISTSSMHANVVSGFFSASMMMPLSVEPTSALSVHEQSTGRASSAADCTLAFESFRHSSTCGMHSARQGPIVRRAFLASVAASCRHSTLERPPPPTTCMPSYRAGMTVFTETPERPSIRLRIPSVAASATFLSLSVIVLTMRKSSGMPYGSNSALSVWQSTPTAR